MRHSPCRRNLLLASAALPLAASTSWASQPAQPNQASSTSRLAALEAASGGRLGVAALNTANGAQLSHRADERFAFCSTFKVLLASAILKRSETEPGLLQQKVRYTKAALVNNSSIAEQHVATGMTVAELCAATLQYSDNTAGNLLIEQLGGTAAVTAHARSIGDEVFRLDRRLTELKTALPGDPRDTTTPTAMMKSLQALALGQALGNAQRQQLVTWMLGSTTGTTRIRAGVPKDWQVADKTGSGDYGSANDVGVLWPKDKPPIVLAIYFTHPDQDAPHHNEVLAMAARIVAETFA
ncbi:serine hydrolase [Chitinimonas naiadis]